jgi:hypothetical protein
MSALKICVDYYLKNNNNRNNDEFEDDMLDFEDELANQDKINRSILNIENNKQNLIGDDNEINGLLNLVNNDFENNHCTIKSQISQIFYIKLLSYLRVYFYLLNYECLQTQTTC